MSMDGKSVRELTTSSGLLTSKWGYELLFLWDSREGRGGGRRRKERKNQTNTCNGNNGQPEVLNVT